MPTIPPNNNTGLYGIDGSAVAVSNDVTVDNLAATGNITAGGNITAQGNIAADYFIGDGSQLTNINAGNIVGGYGNANVAAYLASGTNTSNVITTGNVSGQFILGDGSQLTGLPATYGNANVNAHLAAFGSNTIATTGNITGGYFIGDGSQLTGLPASYGNANVATFLPTYTGNLAGGNIAVTNNANIGGNLTVDGTIFGTFAGNITGNIVVPGANTQVLFNNNGNVGANPGLTFNSDSNVLSVVGSANVSALNAAGNITAGQRITSANISVAGGATFISANVNTQALQANTIGSNTSIQAGTTISATGNITGGNIVTATNVVAGGNIVGGNISTTGNVTGANLVGTILTASQTNITSVGFLNSLNVLGNTALQGLTADTITAYDGVRLYSTGFLDGYVELTVGAVVDPVTLRFPSTQGANGTYLQNNGSGTLTWTTPTGSYGNANVAAYLPTYTGNIAAGNLTAPTTTVTGNLEVFGGNLSTTNGQNVFLEAIDIVQIGTYGPGQGVQITGPGVFGVANLTGTLASFTGNVAAGGVKTDNYYYANGTPISFGGTYGDSNVTTLLNAFGSNTITTTGNVTAGNIVANGQALTNLPAANIVGTVANATYAVNAGIATVADTANAVAGANVTGQVANALVAGTVYTNAQPNITSVGTLTSLSVTGNVTGGNINTAGNVSGSYIFGNGSQLTGLPATYSDANVTTLLASFGSNSIATTGNVTAGFVAGNGSLLSSITGANVTGTVASATQANTANVANSVSGSNVVGAVANATFATSAASATTAGTVTTNAQPNITSVGTLSSLSVTGNITGGNILTTGSGGSITGADFVYANTVVANSSITTNGTVTAGAVQYTNVDGTTGQVLTTYGNGVTYFSTPAAASYGNANVATLLAAFGSNTIVTTGNITGGNVIATTAVRSGAVTITGTDGTSGQVLTTYGNGVTYFSTVSGGSGSPGGANTELQFNDGGAFAGNAAMTFDKTNGNISFGNLVIGNIGSSGTFYNVLTNKNAFTANSTTQPSNARILVGSGRNGDWSTTADVASNGRNARMVVMDEYVRTDNGVRSTELAVQSFANLNGATTYGTANSNSRIQGFISDLYVANGNTVNVGNPYYVRAGGFNLSVGTSANTGNANISQATGLSSFITLNTGSSAGNAIAMQVGVGASNGTANTQIGYSIGLQGLTSNTTGNVFGVYMPGNATTYGTLTGANTRAAANYYFLRCDDDIAQNKLGSLRTFHEFQYTASISSGAVTIDKNNAQVQYVDVTEDITSITLSNFVTRATQTSPAIAKLQADTVTVIFRQDATGRAITMPSGSAYKYAGGGNIVGDTANSVTMVSITGIYNSTAAATEYLITISPEFV